MASNTNTTQAQPTMDNPTVIDLSTTGGQNYWQFSANQDVIFLGDTTQARTDKLQIDGGHNVMVLGGEYQPTTAPTGTLAFRGTAGTVFVEGVHVDNSKSSGTDGIVISGGAKTSFVVQNSIIENVNGAKGGGQAAKGNGHADAVQIQGDLGGEVLLHNVHATTNYQGLFLAPQYAVHPTKVTLDNVDLHYTGASNDGSEKSYLLWSNDDPSQQAHVPWSFDNVYVQPRDGQQAIESAVWPKSGMGAVQNGNQISWPDMPYKGSVTIGNHSSFVDEAKIGLHYKADANLKADTGTTGLKESAPSTSPAPAVEAHAHQSAAPTHWITSTDGHTHVTGTAGNDQIAGVQKVADVGGLAGGKGDDTYIIGDARDKVVEHGKEGVDTVMSHAPSYTLPAGVENLVLADNGKANISGTGNSWHNMLTGNDGNNVLKGMAGNDVLSGGDQGRDALVGGSGDDTFVLKAAGGGLDTIKDFKIGEDTLNVQALLKSVGASTVKQAIHDDTLNVLQNGTNAEVTAKVAGHDVKVAVVEDMDAAALVKTADHWQ